MADWNSPEYAEGDGERYWVKPATADLPDIFISHPDKGRAGALRRAANAVVSHAPSVGVSQWLDDEYRLGEACADQLADEIRQLRKYGKAAATLYIPVGLPGAPAPGERWPAGDPDLRRYVADGAAAAPLLQQGFRVLVSLQQADGARRLAALATECGAEVRFLDATGNPVNIVNLYRLLVASGECQPGIADSQVRQAANPYYCRLAKPPAREAVSTILAWSRRQIAEIRSVIADHRGAGA